MQTKEKNNQAKMSIQIYQPQINKAIDKENTRL